MKIDILTLFPEMFTPVTEASMLGRAAEKGILEFHLHNIRDYTQDKHNRTDDYPFGGGGGMVQMADPIFRAMEFKKFLPALGLAVLASAWTIPVTFAQGTLGECPIMKSNP